MRRTLPRHYRRGRSRVSHQGATCGQRIFREAARAGIEGEDRVGSSVVQTMPLRGFTRVTYGSTLLSGNSNSVIAPVAGSSRARRLPAYSGIQTMRSGPMSRRRGPELGVGMFQTRKVRRCVSNSKTRFPISSLPTPARWQPRGFGNRSGAHEPRGAQDLEALRHLRVQADTNDDARRPGEVAIEPGASVGRQGNTVRVDADIPGAPLSRGGIEARNLVRIAEHNPPRPSRRSQVRAGPHPAPESGPDETHRFADRVPASRV